MIVLNEVRGQSHLLKLVCAKGFHEKTSGVPDYLRYQDSNFAQRVRLYRERHSSFAAQAVNNEN